MRTSVYGEKDLRLTRFRCDSYEVARLLLDVFIVVEPLFVIGRGYVAGVL